MLPPAFQKTRALVFARGLGDADGSVCDDPAFLAGRRGRASVVVAELFGTIVPLILLKRPVRRVLRHTEFDTVLGACEDLFFGSAVRILQDAAEGFAGGSTAFEGADLLLGLFDLRAAGGEEDEGEEGKGAGNSFVPIHWGF
ncbi:MAG: hypothetical protein NXI35_12280 [bacterium]|nr:hypothetical protein [bacterium]